MTVIRTRVKLGRAQVVIANAVPAAPSRPGSGMALKNVRERLHLMHDMAAQFEARRVDGAFRVQLVVPYEARHCASLIVDDEELARACACTLVGD